MWCALTQNKCSGSFIFEGPAVTGDTFLVMMQDSALRHIAVGTAFQSDDAPPHFLRRIRAFMYRFS
jgi:hypothetical protein